MANSRRNFQNALKSLKKTAKDVTKEFVRTKRVRVSQKVYEDRILACAVCEKFDKKTWRCKQMNCGCNMKIKARLSAVQCPLSKW